MDLRTPENTYSFLQNGGEYETEMLVNQMMMTKSASTWEWRDVCQFRSDEVNAIWLRENTATGGAKNVNSLEIVLNITSTSPKYQNNAVASTWSYWVLFITCILMNNKEARSQIVLYIVLLSTPWSFNQHQIKADQEHKNSELRHTSGLGAMQLVGQLRSWPISFFL